MSSVSQTTAPITHTSTEYFANPMQLAQVTTQVNSFTQTMSATNAESQHLLHITPGELLPTYNDELKALPSYYSQKDSIRQKASFEVHMLEWHIKQLKTPRNIELCSEEIQQKIAVYAFTPRAIRALMSLSRYESVRARAEERPISPQQLFEMFQHPQIPPAWRAVAIAHPRFPSENITVEMFNRVTFDEQKALLKNPSIASQVLAHAANKALSNLAEQINIALLTNIAGNQNTPTHLLDLIEATQQENLLGAVATNPQLSPEKLDQLIAHSNGIVLLNAGKNPNLSAAQLTTLAIRAKEFNFEKEKDGIRINLKSAIKTTVAKHNNTSPQTLTRLAKSQWPNVQMAVLNNSQSPRQAVQTLLRSNHREVRALAENLLR